ncbi:MAG TPA: RNA methyltransferase [Chloroflexia bacterium]|nr:RNA methyltransferase [Chloroflexia bacterium]
MSEVSVLDNIVVVLYQPQDVVNVGSVVRVMSNFGLKKLRLVEPAAYDPYRIEGIAHHTRPIIDAIERFPSLDAALADCGFVLGATARKRGVRREYLTPRAAAKVALEAARKGPGVPVALLFGREDNGLPNEALDNCHALITIPTDPTNPSLNLAQAALVVAYEVWLSANPPQEAGESNVLASGRVDAPRRAGQPPRRGETPSVTESIQALEEDAQLATGTEREFMFKALADLLWTLYPNTTETRVTYSMTRLRAVLLRAAPRNDEGRAIAHLFHHIAQVLRGSSRDESEREQAE